MNMKFLIETHGCKLNAADSQKLAQEFVAAGYSVAHDGDAPDVFVLNSCTVTHVADRKARQAAASARRRFPSALTVVTGCYAERAEDAVAALACVDMAVTNRGKSGVVARVTERLGARLTPCTDGAAIAAAPLLLGRTRASVKIQEGCDQVCAYCIVPKVRGRERSIPEGQIVAEVRSLAEAGIPEVVLTGTQLGSYGSDIGGTDLARMVARTLLETPVRRLRVSSLQPLEVTDALLGVWTGPGRGRLCPHFHLPLQSGSSDVLTRMRRRYGPDEFLRTVERVRAAVPDCSVTTDVIAGFPGETDADHAATLAVMEAARFADAHVFPYSARPGTSAAHFAGQAPVEVRAARAAELREVAGRHAVAHRRGFVGSVRQVLWELRRGSEGLTDNYLRVRLAGAHGRGGPALVRDRDTLIEDVRLTGLDGDVMTGEPVRVGEVLLAGTEGA